MGTTKKTKAPRALLDTPESKALAKAWKDYRGADTQGSLAAALGVSEGMVWQMLNRRRPLPWDKAEAVARRLGVDPATISAEYARHQEQAPIAQLPAATMRADLQVNRLENDIDSLRWYVTALTDIMMRYRPVEAADLMETVRTKVPAKFRDNGFLLELTEAMAKARPASAKVPAAARKRAKRQSA